MLRIISFFMHNALTLLTLKAHACSAAAFNGLDPPLVLCRPAGSALFPCYCRCSTTTPDCSGLSLELNDSVACGVHVAISRKMIYAIGPLVSLHYHCRFTGLRSNGILAVNKHLAMLTASPSNGAQSVCQYSGVFSVHSS